MIESQKFVQAMVATTDYTWSPEYALGYVCAAAHGYSRGFISMAQMMKDIRAVEDVQKLVGDGWQNGFTDAAILLSIADGIPLEAAAALTPRPAGGEQPPRS